MDMERDRIIDVDEQLYEPVTSIELQSMVDSHDMPFVVIDRNYRIVAVNEAYKKTFSYPDGDAIAYVVLENPHLRTLAEIQQELFAGIEGLREASSVSPGRLEAFLTHLVSKYGLYKLLGQKRAFTLAYERGLGSNISLSVHTYATASNFIMVKDVISPLPYYPKIHVCGPVKKPVLDDGMLLSKDMLQIQVTTDHRVVNGVHAHEFGQSLARIAAHPEQFLQ